MIRMNKKRSHNGSEQHGAEISAAGKAARGVLREFLIQLRLRSALLPLKDSSEWKEVPEEAKEHYEYDGHHQDGE